MRLSEAGGRAVATEITGMFKSVDTALFDAARLAATIMETNAASAVPPAHLQGALDSAAAGFAKLVEGRRDMVQMHRKLAHIKGESQHRETDWGCFGDDEPRGVLKVAEMARR
jgi:hypothetical protein